MREAATRARRKTGGTCTTRRDLHFELVLRFREKHLRRPVTGATRHFRVAPGVYANKNTELNIVGSDSYLSGAPVAVRGTVARAWIWVPGAGATSYGLLFTDCGRGMSHTVPKRRDGDADDLSVDLSVGIDDRRQVTLDQHHELSPRR